MNNDLVNQNIHIITARTIKLVGPVVNITLC